MKRATLTAVFVVVLVVATMLAGCGRSAAPSPAASATSVSAEAANTQPAQDLIKVNLPMGYIPNIQYAPFYVAVEKGFYREAGFDVTFDYSFETDGVALVGANQRPFAIVSGEQVLMARDQNVPVVYVMAWWQKYPIVVIADAKLGLKSPADLKGQRIGLPGLFGANYVGLMALLYEFGLSEQDVTLDAIGFNQVEAFASGQEPIVVGYVTNEPIQLEAQGYDITTFPVADYVTLASNGLITNETLLKEQPEMVHRFVLATLRGINYTIHYPHEAYEISTKYVEGLTDEDYDIQMQILKTAIEYWKGDPLGYAQPEAWEKMQKVLKAMGLITHDQDVTKAYTNDFIRP